MIRAIPQAAIDLVKDQESCVLHAYKDPIGIITVGYGHTGEDIIPGDPVSQDQADTWLSMDLETAATRLCGIIGGVVSDLTTNQYAALLDFVFNLGCDPKWTIWKRLNARQFDQVPLEIAKFVNAGGKKLQGLVNRRNAEIALWATGEPGTVEEPATPSSSMTRTTVTPPTPADPVPVTKSKGLIAGAVGAISIVPAAVDQAWHVLQPYTQHSALVERAVGGMFTVAAGCAVVSLAYTWIQKRNARN